MNRNLVFILILIICLISACTEDYTSKKYIKKVLANLENIESATYNTIGENWVPGDTTASYIEHNMIKEYNYSADTTIGAKYVKFERDDSTKVKFCYDGKMRAVFYNEHKGIVVDSFKVRKLPFRPVNPPFFNYTKNILDYAISTKDSVVLDIQDLSDSVYLKLTINEENQVEFFGKATYMPLSPYSYDNTSIFEVWINKTDNLPYKVRREMSHNISVTTCENYELNKLHIEDFVATDYFPKNYEIRPYGVKRKQSGTHLLLNKTAPDWSLQSTENSTVSLKDFKNKVTLIQFTSVSCGPCKASIPFLKQLATEYKQENFDFVSIECTCNNSDALKRYMNRNDFDYKFLLSSTEVREKYSIRSYPVFFVLDENQVIKAVMNGYGKGVEDKINDAINKLI